MSRNSISRCRHCYCYWRFPLYHDYDRYREPRSEKDGKPGPRFSVCVCACVCLSMTPVAARGSERASEIVNKYTGGSESIPAGEILRRKFSKSTSSDVDFSLHTITGNTSTESLERARESDELCLTHLSRRGSSFFRRRSDNGRESRRYSKSTLSDIRVDHW